MKFRELQQVSNGGSYLKLEDGTSVKGVFRGDLFEFHTHWIGQRTSPCTEKEDCPSCLKGIKQTFRFKVNFIVSENGALTAKVWEQGATVYNTLKALHESDYDITAYFMKITRDGTGKNTTYQVLPLPKGEVTPETEKKLKAVKLEELKAPEAVPAEEESDFAMPAEESDGIPF